MRSLSEYFVLHLFLGLKAVEAVVYPPSSVFDYIVVGAGTCGLLVANRLSADPSVRVAVIEPGGDERNNPNVTNADLFTVALGTNVDWNYVTVPQPGLGGRALDYHSGKAIGGTSTINGMTYIRANEAEVDILESLGNTGWNWDTLFPYYKRTEKFLIPTSAQQAVGVTYNPNFHGTSGDMHVSYPFRVTNSSEVVDTLIETFENLSIPHNLDSSGGKVHGASANPSTMDRDLNLRWDAAQAFYYPVESRPNLKIVKGTVTKIVWANNAGRKAVAKGVEYLKEDGTTAVLTAAKEVVLSAGTLRTPLILEGSGVGNPSVLNKLGIDVKIPLPGVGENFQEQPNSGLAYDNTLSAMSGYVVIQTFVTAAELFGGASGAAAVSASILSKIPSWAQQIVSASGGPTAVNKTAVEIVLRAQHDLLFSRKNENATLSELIIVVAEGGISGANYWYLFPFSRGSVHLASAPTGTKGGGGVDPSRNMLIDPRFNLLDFDLDAQVASGKLADKIWNTEPIGRFISGRTFPALQDLPLNATNQQWRDVIAAGIVGNSHPIGTASMLPKELGGVVDPELRVYGTGNVRVVDSSILPFQFSGHPTASLYAIAERAAEIIKSTPPTHGGPW